MAIIIENLQNKVAITDEIENLIRNAAELSLELQGFTLPAEIDILLVDDEKIREINNEHRNIDSPTDVLSFPMVDMKEGVIISDEGDYDLDENTLILGDIVVSLETAKRQAEEYGHSFERELAFLVTHGSYHLLGFDHMEPEEEKRMMEKQEAVLSKMGLAR
ncbi:rRNA maturation RNase YbeY [Clostridium thermosuccinogenes]|jgi:probable rRNA maturation factor|uniref:Endoribonuclease YbeY n=1 Tax=Clostridium thermosuccinogenes TaxID=84032 RepID=A0A2K2F2E9_9CLOT|nr:rRNA maturation RNase YbeY [Pseudoclostridium thermosuccinogenes]AUS96388.1 rRNA maturation RNase YbeY [Pseudoclostridium thermosuccinogenes]PNT92946.1 rRNA maturation RNase YbeY [Pseudoclostridium thermosuccinogenes]PNT95662.1 rRNA maturation RNase YbeY [Pseudoclostridium thermosuccinogenes]PNT96885.1 rRNA maturation RNase YbeY [Pseudoclostridium thermosuccinogenes]